jgi:hypothetical protein
MCIFRIPYLKFHLLKVKTRSHLPRLHWSPVPAYALDMADLTHSYWTFTWSKRHVDRDRGSREF